MLVQVVTAELKFVRYIVTRAIMGLQQKALSTR